jgi:ubiquinone/menaquinone biosynthesis C-methylase UbiE
MKLLTSIFAFSIGLFLTGCVDAQSADGIGKRYMGREIAQVMGHQAADWLERPERLVEERPDLLMSELDLKPGMIVADIGAGTGFHASRMAQLVGPNGKAYAVDIQPEMLALLDKSMKRQGIYNVQPVLGKENDPNLDANTFDLIIMVDVYHELAFPAQMMTKMVDALKPGGRLVFVEFKAEDPRVPIKALHKMSEAQIRKEAEVFPLTWVRTAKTLPWQHVVIFKKQVR